MFTHNYNLNWCFGNLLPATTYTFVMTTFSQRKHATSYPLEVTTKPSSPSLEKQEINEVDNTVNIVLAFPEKVDECEYEVLCNSAQSSHGHFKYRQRFSVHGSINNLKIANENTEVFHLLISPNRVLE